MHPREQLVLLVGRGALGQHASADQPGLRVGGDQLLELGCRSCPRLGQAMDAAGVGDDVGAHVPGRRRV